MNPREDTEIIQAEERGILDGFKEEIAAAFSRIESASLVGRYPGTVIRVTATGDGQTRTCEWSIWDGKLTGCPPGETGGKEEYLTLLLARVIGWLTSPRWSQHDPPSCSP